MLQYNPTSSLPHLFERLAVSVWNWNLPTPPRRRTRKCENGLRQEYLVMFIEMALEC